MIQRQTHHPVGTFAACAICAREPKHYVVYGRCTRDPIDFTAPTQRHIIECLCTGPDRRTALHVDFVAAAIEWRDRFSTAAIGLKFARKRAA